MYIYLSLYPESLIASMLEPEQFGTYLATGTKKRTQGPAMFFDLRNDFTSKDFDLELAKKRCVPKPNGEPKHSVYLSIYRVLERVPLEAINNIWLTTRDGRVLKLEQTKQLQEFPGKYHLYQELSPVHPLVVSTLEPADFCRFITDPNRPTSVPKIAFVEMDLSELADNPDTGQAKNLPYYGMAHLRDCLMELKNNPEKKIKMVNRIQPEVFPYRCIQGGFFVGDQQGMLYYPFPSYEQLENEHYLWWRSANV